MFYAVRVIAIFFLASFSPSMLYFPSISKWFQVERKWRPVRQQPIKKRLEKSRHWFAKRPMGELADWVKGRVGVFAHVQLPQVFFNMRDTSAQSPSRTRRLEPTADSGGRCGSNKMRPIGFPFICSTVQWTKRRLNLFSEPVELLSTHTHTDTHTSMLNVWSHNYCGVSEEAAASECWPKRITCHIKETHTIKMTTYQKEGWKKNEVKCWHECVHSSSGRIHSSPRQNFHKKDGRCLFWLEEFGRERVQLILLRWPKRQNLCPSLYGCHTNRPQTSSNPSKKTLYRYTSDRTFFQG